MMEKFYIDSSIKNIDRGNYVRGWLPQADTRKRMTGHIIQIVMAMAFEDVRGTLEDFVKGYFRKDCCYSANAVS